MRNKIKKKLIIFGPQGAGKGTQAELIAEYFGLAHISTGGLMRLEIKKNSRIGRLIAKDMESGNIANLAAAATLLIKKRLQKNDIKKKGFIIDGYPRNYEQLLALDRLVVLTQVIVLKVTEKKLIDRLTSRLVCSECETNYNSKTNPPKKSGVCDICGGKIKSRQDDNPQAIKNRLKYHRLETQPLVNFYKKRGITLEIDGNRSIEQVFEDIKNKLE